MRTYRATLVLATVFVLGLVAFCTPSHAATFDGIDDWTAATTCGATAGDLTWTIRARVATTATTAPTGRAAVTECSASSSTSYAYLGLSPGLVAECSARGGVQVYARGAASIADGVSRVIHCVSDGMALTVYVDGQPKGTAPLATPSGTVTPGPRGLCTLGALRRPSGTSNYWQGDVSAVATWDRALTTAEIQADAGGGPEPPTVENCHGHTGLVWAAYPDPTVTHFEVERSVGGLDAWSDAGDTREKNRPAVPDEGYPAIRAESWDLLRAWSLPAEGVRYDYRVRAVRGALKSPPSNVLACPPQDPTRCYPVACP